MRAYLDNVTKAMLQKKISPMLILHSMLSFNLIDQTIQKMENYQCKWWLVGKLSVFADMCVGISFFLCIFSELLKIRYNVNSMIKCTFIDSRDDFQTPVYFRHNLTYILVRSNCC